MKRRNKQWTSTKGTDICVEKYYINRNKLEINKIVYLRMDKNNDILKV